MLDNWLAIASNYAEESEIKNSTPKKGGKANKTARGGTPPAGGAARRADSPTITGLNGDDDAVIEQVLQNQETIGELVKKTSSMEGSLQRILVLLEKKRSGDDDDDDDDDDCAPRGRGTSTSRVKGQRGPSPRRRDASPRRRDDVARRDYNQQSRTIHLDEQGRQVHHSSRRGRSRSSIVSRSRSSSSQGSSRSSGRHTLARDDPESVSSTS